MSELLMQQLEKALVSYSVENVELAGGLAVYPVGRRTITGEGKEITKEWELAVIKPNGDRIGWCFVDGEILVLPSWATREEVGKK